ncbi:MAG: lysylphosphatidylglycerol synthase transmembrane domain-containing protein [Mycobacterium sp.]
MRVDGRDVSVSGNLLQPLTRRTNDILRLAVSITFLALVITGSLITRPQWEALEKSISQIVGVLSPKQADLVYLAYGIAILALPFMILIGLIVARKWKPLGAFAAAALLAALPLSLGDKGFSAPRYHFDLSDRLQTVLAQFLDDPRWIAMLAAVLTVSGPWQPARWRRWWWALLLAFVPIHLVVSAIIPARALLGLAVGWVVGALVVLVVGTPALEVPLEAAVRAMAKRGFVLSRLTVVQPAGRGPLVLAGECDQLDGPAVSGSALSGSALIELYGPHQRSGGALSQLWGKLRLRDAETPPLVASMRRAVEHRALMAVAIGELGLANISAIALTDLNGGWMLYAHKPCRGTPLTDCVSTTPVARPWESLKILNDHQISHGDLRPRWITVDDGTVLFGDFFTAEYGATDAALQSDIAQLLVTTSALYDPQSAVAAAIDVCGEDTVLAAGRRLTKAAVPKHLRRSIPDGAALIAATRAEVKRQTGADQIKTETITRFTRGQVIQLVLFGALVYVAYPFISTVPTFFSELRHADWWWALLGLTVSALTYVGAAGSLWSCTDGTVSYRRLLIAQLASTFAATTTPAGVGGLALSTRILQKSGGMSTMRATAAVALQQAMQVIVHLALLIVFSVAAGVTADLSHFVPGATLLYLIAGVALGIIGTVFLVPRLRTWLATSVRPRLAEVARDLGDLAREPRRLALILIGSAGTTLGAALALWSSIQAFGGNTTFITVTIVTMVGGTLAAAAPTPGGVGAVEAALIGGLAAFGLPAAVCVPSVLLYRILTCWLPVFVGWPVMRWLNDNDMI